jgi:hypothetical protein
MISLFNIKLFSRHASIADFKKLSLYQQVHLKREYQNSIARRQHIFEKLYQQFPCYYYLGQNFKYD